MSTVTAVPSIHEHPFEHAFYTHINPPSPPEPHLAWDLHGDRQDHQNQQQQQHQQQQMPQSSHYQHHDSDQHQLHRPPGFCQTDQESFQEAYTHAIHNSLRAHNSFSSLTSSSALPMLAMDSSMDLDMAGHSYGHHLSHDSGHSTSQILHDIYNSNISSNQSSDASEVFSNRSPQQTTASRKGFGLKNDAKKQPKPAPPSRRSTRIGNNSRTPGNKKVAAAQAPKTKPVTMPSKQKQVSNGKGRVGGPSRATPLQGKMQLAAGKSSKTSSRTLNESLSDVDMDNSDGDSDDTSSTQNDVNNNNNSSSNNTTVAKKCSKNDQVAERKRQHYLERNRLAASKSRDKKRRQTAALMENADLIVARNQEMHQTLDNLQDEIRTLKNQILCHRGCGCTVIQEYIKSSAGAHHRSRPRERVVAMEE